MAEHAGTERAICPSTALEERGTGVRFETTHAGQPAPAFVVRFDGVPRAFLNRCGHVPVELDWQEGVFFDFDRDFLICSTHGALYHPASGVCVGGRCNGRGLVPLAVAERDGLIYLTETPHE